MRFRWLLIATFTMLLAPSLASAKSRPRYASYATIQAMEAEGKGDPTSLVVDAPTPTPTLHRCGLRYTPPPPPAQRKPSKLPYVLSIAGLLAAFALRKRAGTDEVHVPDCLP